MSKYGSIYSADPFTNHKVFNYQNMPQEIKDAMYTFVKKCHFSRGRGKDSFVPIWINHCIPTAMDENEKIVQRWLIANGAEGDLSSEEEGEMVLVYFWW